LCLEEVREKFEEQSLCVWVGEGASHPSPRKKKKRCARAVPLRVRATFQIPLGSLPFSDRLSGVWRCTPPSGAASVRAWIRPSVGASCAAWAWAPQLRWGIQRPGLLAIARSCSSKCGVGLQSRRMLPQARVCSSGLGGDFPSSDVASGARIGSPELGFGRQSSDVASRARIWPSELGLGLQSLEVLARARMCLSGLGLRRHHTEVPSRAWIWSEHGLAF